MRLVKGSVRGLFRWSSISRTQLKEGRQAGRRAAAQGILTALILMALHNFPVQWTADNVADRDPQRLSPCRCPSYFTTLTYIMKRSVSHAGPCTVPVPAAHVLFVYVDAVKGLPDPQHGRELVVCRCRFRRQLRMLDVCADPAHSLRSCISFLLLQLSCLLSFWKATKGWRQQPGGSRQDALCRPQ